MTPEEAAVIKAARRAVHEYMPDTLRGTFLADAVMALDAARRPLAPKAWDADRPGCAPEICGGSNLDPCSAVMRTEGTVHDDDDLGGALERTWHEIAEGDWVQGSDKAWYRVLRVAEGGGPNLGRTVVTMQIGGEARPYPMSPEGDVLVKRGPAGIAVERLRAAGLSPEALR